VHGYIWNDEVTVERDVMIKLATVSDRCCRMTHAPSSAKISRICWGRLLRGVARSSRRSSSARREADGIRSGAFDAVVQRGPGETDDLLIGGVMRFLAGGARKQRIGEQQNMKKI
jgi:hypothetical protein